MFQEFLDKGKGLSEYSEVVLQITNDYIDLFEEVLELRKRLAVAKLLLHSPEYEVSYLDGSQYRRIKITCLHSRPGWIIGRINESGETEFLKIESKSLMESETPIDAVIAAWDAGWLKVHDTKETGAGDVHSPENQTG